MAVFHARLFVLKLLLDISDEMDIPDETRRRRWISAQGNQFALFGSEIFLDLSHQFSSWDSAGLRLATLHILNIGIVPRPGGRMPTVVLDEAQEPANVTMRNAPSGKEVTLLDAIMLSIRQDFDEYIISGTGTYTKKIGKRTRMGVAKMGYGGSSLYEDTGAMEWWVVA
jgi:hypothetical protein